MPEWLAKQQGRARFQRMVSVMSSVGQSFDTLKVTLEEAERDWQKPPTAASSPDVRLNHRSERAKRLETNRVALLTTWMERLKYLAASVEFSPR
jgi:hypothetical protein